MAYYNGKKIALYGSTVNSGGGGGSKLYLHIIKIIFTFGVDTPYPDATGKIKLQYISDRAEPYDRHTYLATIPNFFEQQIGKAYYAQDYLDYRDWLAMFNEVYSENTAVITGWNYRGETFNVNLLSHRVESDTVIEL